MVFILIGILVFSIVGMVAILSVKRYELTTGKLILGSVRPGLSRKSSRAHFVVTRWLPAYVLYVLFRMYVYVRGWVQKLAARLVLFLERVLERVLIEVKERTTPNRAPGEASPFLREVGKYKEEIAQNGERSIKEE